jgi:hypothetical protein
MPSEVAASSGLDILSHAVESFTALPFTERPPNRLAQTRYRGPDQRCVAAGDAPVARFLIRRRRPCRRRGACEHAVGCVARASAS